MTTLKQVFLRSGEGRWVHAMFLTYSNSPSHITMSPRTPCIEFAEMATLRRRRLNPEHLWWPSSPTNHIYIVARNSFNRLPHVASPQHTTFQYYCLLLSMTNESSVKRPLEASSSSGERASKRPRSALFIISAMHEIDRDSATAMKPSLRFWPDRMSTDSPSTKR